MDDIWLYARKGFDKFRERQLCVSVEVKAAHDCYELALDRLVTHLLEKPTKCCLIDVAIVEFVNRLESPANAELVEVLEIGLELLKLELEVDLSSKCLG